MNKLFALTLRNLKEIIRSPLSAIFCIGFPLVMLVLMSLILSQIPSTPENFQINSFSAGICVFGYTFSMLFVAMIIAGDKNTEFINRINIAPIRKTTYLASHFLAMLPITLLQTVLFFLVSLCFGLKISLNLLVAIIYLLPSAIFYISLGILIGTITKNEKQSSPICSIFISAVGILGGVFMPLEGMGTLSTIANLLPFSHTVQISSQALIGNLGSIFPHILWICGYTLLIWGLTFLFYKQKK